MGRRPVEPMTDSAIGVDFRVADYVEPAHGFRMWRTGELDGLAYLTSTTGGVMWPTDNALQAQHVGDSAAWLALNIYHLADKDPVPPVRRCACGIYAYTDAAELIRGEATAMALYQRVIGEVELWGKVWEHERGYRAQFARVRSLWWTGHGMSLPVVQVLADRYNVPVVEDLSFGRRPA